MTESMPDELRQKLLSIVAKEGMVDLAQLKNDTKLDELNIQSADVIVVLMAIEEEFEAYIPIDSALSESKTVGDLLAAIQPHLIKGANC